MRRLHRLLACLTVISVFICLFTSACSDKDRDANKRQTDDATVRFIFSLAASKGEVPITVKGFQFIGFADEAMQEKIAHEPWVCPKDETKLGAQQVVVLDDVPTNTVRFRINFLDEHDQIIGHYDTKVISLNPGDVKAIPIYSEDETITKLNVVFDSAKVPAEAKSCDIEVLDAEGTVLARVSGVGVDGYVFENVEMSAATVSVIYRDADKAKIASAEGTVSGAQPGEECSVTIGEATPIVGFSLNVVFDPAKVPAEAKSCDIEVLDAEGNVLAQTSDAGVDGYVFENVEMSAATVSVIYRDADKAKIAHAEGTVSGAQRGEECSVTIGEATPIVGFSLNVVFDPAKVPAEAKSCDIEVLDAEGDVLAQTSDAGVDGYVFENVEMSAATVSVIYRDADKAKIAHAEGTVSGAQPGEECSVTIGEATPIVGFTLNVVFDPVKVPAEAKSCDIEVLDAEGNVLAQTTDAGVDGYVFENMEMSAATVAVIYKDADGKEIASANGTVTGAQRGEECDVTIGEATPIKTLVTIDIANSYPMNVTKVTYEVEYNSTEGDSQTAKGTADYTVTDETGSCSISFEPQGEDVAITNVKLSNPQNEIPFEWLTYSEAQAVQEDGTLVLDVNDNEFAGGAGTESDPFLVGNPRQLRQIEKYCGVGQRSDVYYYYKQIKDIDFEGSCGITIDLDYNNDGELTITPNMVDKTARFNEDNSHGGSTYTCAGWCPLAGNNDRANDYYFRGTYDGDFHAIRDVVSYLDRNHDDSFRMHGDASLFGQLQTSRFVNMSLTDCVMCGDTSVGLLYSFSIDRDKSGITSVAVENCTFKGIVAGNDCIGGVCGSSAYLNASDCKTSVEIYGAHEVGGMCGKADFTLKVANCETVCDMHVCKSTDGWSVGRLGGVCGQVKEFGVESCKANTTMTQYCYSSAVELVFGGLFGECLGYWDYNTLRGASKFTLDCREVYNKSFGGGVFGVARDTDDTSLKAFMRDCVAVTTMDLEGSTCGQYCGSPKIDSLD